MSEEYQGKHEAVVTEAEESGTPPGISARTRTRIYVGSLIVEVIALLVCGFGVIFGFMTFEQATASGGLITTALGLVSTSLAVGYRPTRPGALPSGA